MKNKEDPSINEGARVVTTDLQLYVYADFYDIQGQLIPQCEVGSLRNSNHPSFYGCPCYLQE